MSFQRLHTNYCVQVTIVPLTLVKGNNILVFLHQIFPVIFPLYLEHIDISNLEVHEFLTWFFSVPTAKWRQRRHSAAHGQDLLKSQSQEILQEFHLTRRSTESSYSHQMEKVGLTLSAAAVLTN